MTVSYGRSICSLLRNHHDKEPAHIKLYPQVTHGTDATEGCRTPPPTPGQTTEPLVQQPLSSISVKMRQAEQQEVQNTSEHASLWSPVAEIPLFTQPLHRKSHRHHEVMRPWS